MNSASRWFAVVTKPCLEKVAAAGLVSKGLEAFLPTYQSSRRWSDRQKVLDVPLFPGYTFCQFNSHQRRAVLTTAGVWSIVSFGNGPEPLDDSEVASVRAIVESRVSAAPWPYLKEGRRVRVEGGPLAGVEGIVVNVKNRFRVVVSITLLQRSVGVEVDREDLWPLGSLASLTSAPAY